MSRMISVWIDDATEKRLEHAVKHRAAAGHSVEWYAEASVCEEALRYANGLKEDPADSLSACETEGEK